MLAIRPVDVDKFYISGKYIDVLLPLMLFSNIDHCSMVEVASLAIYVPTLEAMDPEYMPPRSSHHHGFHRPGKNFQLSSTLVAMGGLPRRRGLPSQWLGLHRIGRMAARMQNGLTHWNNSRMDSFIVMRILPQCKQLNTFLKMYV